jgi:hypothetical protein
MRARLGAQFGCVFRSINSAFKSASRRATVCNPFHSVPSVLTHVCSFVAPAVRPIHSQHETRPPGKSEGAEHGRASRRRGSGTEEQGVVTKGVSKVPKFRKHIRTHSAIFSRSSFGRSSSMLFAISCFSFTEREPRLLCTTHPNKSIAGKQNGYEEEHETSVKEGQNKHKNTTLHRTC